MSKYYHVRIDFNDVRLYWNDEKDLSKIISEVVLPYIEEKEFFFESRMVQKIHINELKIFETNAKAKEIHDFYKEVKGFAMGLAKDAPFFYNQRPTTKNITQKLINDAIRKKTGPSSVKVNGVVQNNSTSEISVPKNTTNNKLHLFISYSIRDSESYVEELVLEIEKLGVDFFYDKQSIDWGDNWEDKIYESIDKADYAIIIFSENFGKTTWTKKEQDAFIEKQKSKGDKLILPILHEVKIGELDSTFIKKIQAISTEKYDVKDITIKIAKILLQNYRT